ncbi:MAG: hypothetical protein COA38_15530 [Fluviicola sp.]|nr:MAG: hypothetical protein COA38_15530 [Fluviicola sp.]
MQRLLIILILIVFSISEFKPLVYLAEYAFNYEYIATELCIEKEEPESACKGKCYLTKQLAKAITPNDDSTSERKTPKIESEKAPMILFASESLDFFIAKDQLHSPIIHGDAHFDDITLKIPTPPPRS